MLKALLRWKLPILLVSGLLAVGLFLSRHLVGPRAGGSVPAGPVPAVEAAEHVGSRVEVCGPVAEVVQAQDIGGKPTFINLGGPHPNQAFTALIWDSDRSRWRTSPKSQYADQTICVTGTVELHEGTPQIIVSSPTDIRVR